MGGKMNTLTVESYSKTIMANSRDIMIEICNPLIKIFEINYVNYVRIYNDRTQITLTTYPEWVEHFFKKKYYNHVVCEETSMEIKDKYKILLWNTYKENMDIRRDEKEIFKIDNGVTMISKFSNYVEYFHLGAHPKNYSIEKIYNYNFDIFIQFTKYFKDQANSLIKKASTEKLLRT